MPLANPAAGDRVQVKYFSSYPPQLAINIRHFYVVSVSNAAGTWQNLADAWSNAAAILLKALITSNATYYGLLMAWYNGGPGPAFTTVATSRFGTGPGINAGDPLPTQVAGLVQLRTATPGRRGRGRAYAPFPAEASNGNAGAPAPAAGYLTALSNYGDHLQGDTAITIDVPINSVVLRGQVYHRDISTFTDITTWVPSPQWATQRRRGAFGAANSLPF